MSVVLPGNRRVGVVYLIFITDTFSIWERIILNVFRVVSAEGRRRADICPECFMWGSFSLFLLFLVLG